jgi:DNA mismatch repair ATPase MutS
LSLCVCSIKRWFLQVIPRTVTEILTPGTLQDPQMAGGSAAPRFLSVWEGEGRVFGVCVVECATHSLWMGSFRDDARLSHLETLLLQTVPREAVLCKGACSPTALALVRARVGGGRHLVQMREQGDNFWPPDRARRALEGAFDTSKVPKLLQIATAGQGWRTLLKKIHKQT